MSGKRGVNLDVPFEIHVGQTKKNGDDQRERNPRFWSHGGIVPRMKEAAR